ncbi:Alanine racemase, biosynthetic [Piscirickettsia salmonis]|uniref:alanine racemase n=1 Tax=Piscirickettsia salmonis TaxID=1238 RepID=UPI0012BAAF85|nr:alanine racemase [Piscirickettsia salmonis]QGP55085.1 Alanine racemase, biosynthetic [Piscirickettsia salmonis]QGP59049.1 Alanine racemase, biosynthetic [Piscirickettsia salmonis]QGP64653.1 Alanine racemase, biosynthetic [Piscirickettsia salmonis]
MGRATCVLLSRSALLHNLKKVREKAPNSKILAMIKAYGYGHSFEVAKYLDKKVDGFGVAAIEEAIQLREQGICSPIVLMEGVFSPEELRLVENYNFSIVIHCQEQVDWLHHHALVAKSVDVWLKLDTGMGRLGFDCTSGKCLDYLSAIYLSLKKSNKVGQLGLMSHFACADEPYHQLNSRQISAFQQVRKKFPGPYSCVNSAAIFNFSYERYDWVRPGIMLYGISPFADKNGVDLELQPVMHVVSRLISVKQLRQGESVGYGATWQCPEDMQVGILSLGYGDGYPRLAPSGTPFLVRGQRCALIGRVSMDMIAIDLRRCPDAGVGEAVTVWGQDLPVEEVARHVGTIAYELVCNMPLRAPYIWQE